VVDFVVIGIRIQDMFVKHRCSCMICKGHQLNIRLVTQNTVPNTKGLCEKKYNQIAFFFFLVGNSWHYFQKGHKVTKFGIVNNMTKFKGNVCISKNIVNITQI
jgi:hypothetical protein